MWARVAYKKTEYGDFCEALMGRSSFYRGDDEPKTGSVERIYGWTPEFRVVSVKGRQFRPVNFHCDDTEKTAESSLLVFSEMESRGSPRFLRLT